MCIAVAMKRSLAGMNMRCFATAGKHVNNSQVIAIGNCPVNGFPWQRIRTQWSVYRCTIKMETVFSMRFVSKCYKPGPSSSEVDNCQAVSYEGCEEKALCVP